MNWLALLVIPGFIYFRLARNWHPNIFLKEEKESWPFVLLVLVASGVFFLFARTAEMALALVGLDAPLRSFWHCFIPDFMPVSFSFTLMVAIIIAIILAKFIEGNIFKPLFRGRGNEDLLQFLENFIEDDAEGSKSKPRIPVMVETESGKIYIGYLVEFSLGSGEDPDSKFLIVRPSFSAIMKGSVLNVNTFYTPNDHTKNPQTKRIDVLIPWDTVKTVREFDWDYMLECVKTGTVEIDEKIASLITMESGE